MTGPVMQIFIYDRFPCMKAATLNEIRKHLNSVDQDTLQQLCLALARYRKENKELLTYLLFEAHDEPAFIQGVKLEMDDFFEAVPKGNSYFIKKSLRKIIRFMNKNIRYSGIPGTELEVRIYFCLRVKAAAVPLQPGTVLFNLYQQQVKKIRAVLAKMPEDLQFDYDRDMRSIALD